MSIGWLQHSGDKPYLGDRKVVMALVCEMIDAVTEDPQDNEAAIRRTAAIFSGKDDSYAPIGPWNGEGLARWIREHVEGLPAGNDDEVVAQALAIPVLVFIHTSKAVERGEMTAADERRRMRSILHDWTNLLLGIPFNLYPLPPGEGEGDEI